MMISKFSVKKPYTVLVGVILVIVLGVVSVSRMVTDLLPDMSFPYVLIVTIDPGATPEEVEAEVTAPIEAAMAGTTSIKSIRSVSSNNYSMVILEYEQSTNMDSRIIEIQQSLDLVKGRFKDTIGSPNILQIDPSMLPVMAVAASYEGYDDKQLKLFAEDELVPALESVEGAASVSMASSTSDEIIKITMDEDRIEALNEKIKEAIKKQFDQAKEELDSGKSEIDKARDDMSSGSSQLSNALNDTLNARNELYKNKEDLTKQLEELKGQRESLLTVRGSLTAFTESEDYNGIVEAGEALDSLNAMPDAQKQDPMVAGRIAALTDTINKANEGIASNFASLSAMGVNVKTYKDLPKALSTVGETLTQVNTGIASIEEGLKQIESGEIDLNKAIEALNANASLTALQMGIASGSLAEAAAGLNSAQSTIDKALNDAQSGADLTNILSVDTVGNLIMAQNFNMPAGYVLDGDNQYMVRVSNSVTDMDELKSLVLMDMSLEGIDTITLSQVANVELIQEDSENYAMINGRPGVLLSVQKQTGYSTGASTRNLKKSFDLLSREYPGLSLDVLMDQSVYIDIIVESVVQNIIMGALLACIILLLFLRSIKPTIIIALSIPISVVFALTVMYFTGITLNIISLSGLALGIGMLVDNSIVAVENVYRLRAEGYSIEEAAIKGVNEIAGAITASTLTTVSVYAPIIFTEGITRQLFQDLALTILFTLGASLIVAMTLVPAMAGSMLNKGVKENNKSYNAFSGFYETCLKFCLSHKIITLLVVVAILISSGAAVLSRGMDFLDMDVEADQIMGNINAPEGKSYDFDTLTAKADEVCAIIGEIDDVETVAAMLGGSGITSFIGGGDGVALYIVVDEKTKRSLTEITEEIKEKTAGIDVDLSFTTGSMDYTSYFAQGISVRIQGKDMDKIQNLAREIAGIMEADEAFESVSDGSSRTQPEFRILVDRQKASEYSFTVAQVYAMVAGKLANTTSATNISMDPYDYEVYIETKEQSEVTLKDIEEMTFTHINRDGEEEEIPLSKIADFEHTTTLSSINRTSQTRTFSVSGILKEGYNVTLVSDRVMEKINKLDIPLGYEVTMDGEDETIRDAFSQLTLMMLLAIIFIYLIMVSQFQSLRSPFIIMFTIPLAFTGGFLALLITGITLNVLAMLGFIMLAGLIVNNGIVLIDYINRLREEGKAKKDAIITAGIVRLRPVLMTVLTTVLSVMVIALGVGEGSKMMQPMAVVLVGGLVYGTILTLVVVPCIYDLFHRGE